MIPRDAHYVFGLQEQHEPFHFLHCCFARVLPPVLDPETIYSTTSIAPRDPGGSASRPISPLVDVDLVPEVLAAD